MGLDARAQSGGVVAATPDYLCARETSPMPAPEIDAVVLDVLGTLVDLADQLGEPIR
jgi:hypothetical protein